MGRIARGEGLPRVLCVVCPRARRECCRTAQYGVHRTHHLQGAGSVADGYREPQAALQGVHVEEAFMPAISPTNIEGQRQNEYYPTEAAYLYAIADAMREEYNRIVGAGFLLQIDDPRLVTYYGTNPGVSIEQCRKWAELRVEVLNHALRDIPPDKVRFHTCYSINIGPRVHDMPLQDIVDIVLKINAGA